MVTLLAYGFPPPVRRMPARTAFFCSSIDHPRIRGEKIWYEAPDEEKKRITPAYAGNCPVLRNPGRNAAPRITPARAGKRRPSHVYSHPFWEHPLPMHGKDLLRSPGGRKERITPAHAGKRAAPPPRCPGAEDHPRACGEKETDSSIAKRNSGSPRVCGEKAFSISCNLSMSGSPPPVRGKGNAVLGVLALAGITPACAGKSRSQAHVTYPP